MAQAELPRHTQLYSQLSEDQQDTLGKGIIEKLRTLIGGYGELSVLAEYIAVMLQSNRPSDMIQTELEAFLQEQSKPFTKWLTKEIEKMSRSSGAETERAADAGSEVLLNRVMREAHGRKSSVKVEKKEKRKDRHSRRAAEAAAPAAPAPPIQPKERRSRSRRRRKKEEAARAGIAAPAPPGTVGEALNADAERKSVVLTPNVQFLRDAYHNKVEPGPGEAPEDPASKWHFRAEPLSPLSAPPQASGSFSRPPGQLETYGYPPAGYGAPPGAPPTRGAQPGAAAAPPQQPTRPAMKTIAPKKWKVIRPNTVVRETEQLNSTEVKTLNEGEIIEQVSPSLTLQGGIVRVLIRHPSSPQFPNPIGWVTLDATAAGGPKFLESGPEPMSRGKPWAPPCGTKYAAALGENQTPWRGPPAPMAGTPAPRPATAAAVGVPAAQRGPKGFQNLIWTPGG